MKALEQHVLRSIQRSRIVSAGDRVGVAVSGGADSVALLMLMSALRERIGITLKIVHLNHGLRGAESDADANFVKELARKQELEFIVEREDVAMEARAHKWNLEDAGRRCRHAFFERLVAAGIVDKIAVAHTADDQAETMLAHLLRGTGVTGLAGIYPRAGAVVRPLLAERRAVLREYLRSIGQEWREDATNADTGRLRARIRQKLLPLIEKDFTPKATERLARLASLAQEDTAFWNALVEDRYRTLTYTGEEATRIHTRDLLAPLALGPGGTQAAPTMDSTMQALTERMVRRLYEGAHGSRAGLASAHVKQVIRLARDSSSGSRLDLPGGILVERDFDTLLFHYKRKSKAHESRHSLGAYRYLVELPTSEPVVWVVPELKRQFRLKVIDWSSPRRDTEMDNFTLDADRLRGPLVFRNWRPGDAYKPKGRTGTKKLKEMFLSARVPKAQRTVWPVLESKGRIAWVLGMLPAEEFCARENTRAGLVIEEDRVSGS